MRVEAVVVVVGGEERLGVWVTSRNTTVGCGGGRYVCNEGLIQSETPGTTGGFWNGEMFHGAVGDGEVRRAVGKKTPGLSRAVAAEDDVSRRNLRWEGCSKMKAEERRQQKTARTGSEREAITKIIIRKATDRIQKVSINLNLRFQTCFKFLT
jgi:hypothetical protein